MIVLLWMLWRLWNLAITIAFVGVSMRGFIMHRHNIVLNVSAEALEHSFRRRPPNIILLQGTLFGINLVLDLGTKIASIGA